MLLLTLWSGATRHMGWRENDVWWVRLDSALTFPRLSSWFFSDRGSGWRKAACGMRLRGGEARWLIGCFCGEDFELIPGDAEVTTSHMIKIRSLTPLCCTVAPWSMRSYWSLLFSSFAQFVGSWSWTGPLDIQFIICLIIFSPTSCCEHMNRTESGHLDVFGELTRKSESFCPEKLSLNWCPAKHMLLFNLWTMKHWLRNRDIVIICRFKTDVILFTLDCFHKLKSQYST